MTLRELAEKAIDAGSPTLAGKLADTCRFRLGMNYQQTFEFVQRFRPDLTLPTWDALLYAADEGY